MELVSKFVGDVILFTYKGWLDATFSEKVEDQILEMLTPERRKVILNLKGTEYISSGGLRTLLDISKHVNGKQGKFVVCEVQPQVRDIIAMAGFNKFISVMPTEELAFKYLES